MDRDQTIIEQVDFLIIQAIKKSASDIHLEPKQEHLRVRFRIDGILYDQQLIDKLHALQVVSRVKVLSQLDLVQRRVPQDGKFSFMFQTRPIDCRVSTFPASYGEKIVIRLLDTHQHVWQLDQLGMNHKATTSFKELLNKQSGFVLVSGPTGSGKTTTLYAALSHVNTPEKNIVTLEDPIEYDIAGINQGHIHPAGGFTFAKGMRAVLRQDPDIIMIGEIRDKETARIAIEASLTGHLVLSTIHTDSALGVITRLLDMGVEPYLLSSALTGVVAQRLVRMLCKHCKQMQNFEQAAIMTNDESLIKQLKNETLYRSVGCHDCFEIGYKGRMGLFELLLFDNGLKELVVQYPTYESLQAYVQNIDFANLRQDGIEKLKRGNISLSDLLRIF